MPRYRHFKSLACHQSQQTSQAYQMASISNISLLASIPNLYTFVQILQRETIHYRAQGSDHGTLFAINGFLIVLLNN